MLQLMGALWSSHPGRGTHNNFCFLGTACWKVFIIDWTLELMYAAFLPNSAEFFQTGIIRLHDVEFQYMFSRPMQHVCRAPGVQHGSPKDFVVLKLC